MIKEYRMSLEKKIKKSLKTLREQKPLILNITNFVVMNNTANALLAVGASPIMSHSRKELAEMVAISQALVINMGTLDKAWISRMKYAIQEANLLKKTVVFDPVGCGASNFRTKTARELFAMAETMIIRGNASEILALAGAKSNNKGVDAQDPVEQAVEAAKRLLQTQVNTVIISGETDYVVTQDATYALKNGDAMMPLVTGMGCTHTAITAAFAAVGDLSGLAATAIMGVAGEMAAEKSVGPGSLQMNILDALYQITPQELAEKVKVEKR